MALYRRQFLNGIIQFRIFKRANNLFFYRIILHAVIVIIGISVFWCIMAINLIKMRQIVKFKFIHQLEKFFVCFQTMVDSFSVRETNKILGMIRFTSNRINGIRIVFILTPFWTWVRIFRIIIHFSILRFDFLWVKSKQR